MQVALRGDERPVSSDLAQDVHGDTGVSHPGQARVPQPVAAEVFEAECAHDVIPVGCVAKDRGRDTAATWPGEEPRVRLSRQ